ncbi:MAG: hypothetical protein SNJ56_03990 [Termitinemataceae bacterium]
MKTRRFIYLFAVALGSLLSLLSTGSLIAEEIVMSAFAPRSARILSQGGSFTAVAQGYEALFTNPAAFAGKRGSLTLMLNPWVYGNPRDLLIAAGATESYDGYTGPRGTLFTGPEGIADYLAYASKGGTGLGGSVGLGWVGKGIGLGVINSTDIYVQGSPFPGGVHGYVVSEFAFIGGLGFTLADSKNFSLSFGADVRPVVRFYSPLSATTLVDMLSSPQSVGDNPLNGTTMYTGSALALDAGLQGTLFKNLSFGLSIRDLFGTRYAMSSYPLGDWIERVGTSGLPQDGSPTNDTYLVPMNISAGLGYHVNMGALSWLLDPTVHLELADPLGVFRDKKTPWALVHLGLDTKVLRFISLRAGLNQGYLTAGAGIKLLFLDVNVAAFTRELGRYAGDQPSSGFAVEAALRF